MIYLLRLLNTFLKYLLQIF